MLIRNSNFTFRLIQFFFEGYRPKDLCTFWWMGAAAWAIAIISPPILAVVWMVQWVVPKDSRNDCRFPETIPIVPVVIVGPILIWMSAIAVQAFLLVGIEPTSWKLWNLAYPLAPIGAALATITIVLLFRLIILLIDIIGSVVRSISSLSFAEYRKSFDYKPERKSILIARFRDWKNRTCTRIDYID